MKKRWNEYDYKECERSVTFGDLTDLHFAFNNMKLLVKGEFCFRENKLRVKDPLEVRLEDDYDFHLLFHAPTMNNLFGLADLGNDIALVDNCVGIIRTYKIWVMFRAYNKGEYAIR